MTGLATWQWSVALSAFLLEIGLCLLLFFRRWRFRVPFFTAYVVAIPARELTLFIAYELTGYASRTYFYLAWVAQVVLLCARAGAIVELAWNASRGYPGFRKLTKWLSFLVASGLLLRAAAAAMLGATGFPRFVLTLESGLELTACGVLALLLILSGLYRIPLLRGERWIASGLFLYSAVQVVNDRLSIHSVLTRFSQWNLIRAVSFHLSLLIWIAATVWNRPEATEPRVDLPLLRSLVLQGTGLSQKIAGIVKPSRVFPAPRRKSGDTELPKS